jgi:CelD/BcsL family acetyltransferase involved in cellulose biosynthesis
MQAIPLQVTRVREVLDLSPFLCGWRVLAAGMPMRLPEWLLGWWEAYAAFDDELCVLLLHTPGGLLVGLAPLYLQDVRGRGTFRILGSAENCTHHSNWLSAAGWELRVGAEVARFLLDCKSDWRRLVFESVDTDAAAIHATVSHLAKNGCLWHQRRINSCWQIALPGTWDAYLGMLSKSLRKRCRYLQRQFFDSGKILVRQAVTEADLKEGFGILLKLHAARWGNARKPLGVFGDQRFRNFHERVARDLLARHQLRLAWLECDGQPIAVEYQFFDSGAVYAYQAGIDLSKDEYAPGKLTMMAAIQFAIARGCQSFDLLGGDEPYKANWRATPTACYDLRVWHKGGIGAGEWVVWNGYTQVARKLKTIIPPYFVELVFRLVQATKSALGFFGRTD